MEGKGWHVSRRERRDGSARVSDFRFPMVEIKEAREAEKQDPPRIAKYKNWFLSSRRKGKEIVRESKEQGENVIDGKIYMKYWIGAGVSYLLNKKVQLTRESRRFKETYILIYRRDEKYYFNAIECKILNIDLHEFKYRD